MWENLVSMQSNDPHNRLSVKKIIESNFNTFPCGIIEP